MNSNKIEITGTSEIDLLEREKAVKTILALPTKELKNLASLAGSDKARSYLSNPIKFASLKSFL